MKLVSLNILMGERFGPLEEFIKEQSADTDFFCLQEVSRSSREELNIFDKLATALTDFTPYFAPSQSGFNFGNLEWVDYELEFGIATFVRKNIVIASQGDFFVFRERNSMSENNPADEGKNLQYFRFIKGGKDFTLCNFHGRWFDGPKVDNPESLAQNQKIKEFLDKESGERIICGDFNLNPDTKCMELFEEKMTNLVKKFGITSTRPDSFPKQFSRFADYTLVSPGVQVKSFSVPNIEVSDHLPMILEFDFAGTN